MTLVLPPPRKAEALADVAGPIHAFRQAAGAIIASKRGERTKVEFHREVGTWLDFCETRGINPLVVSVVEATAYREHLVLLPARTGRRRAGATITRSLTALSSIYSALRDLGAVARNPFAASVLARPETSPRNPAGLLGGDEVEALRRAAGADPDRWRGRRDLAVLEVAYWTGLRRQEIGDLQLDDAAFSPRGATLRVVLKGGRIHTAELAAPAARALNSWLGIASLAAGPLFPLARGSDRPLGGAGVYRVIRRLAVRAGLGSGVRPHAFRATLVTSALDAGAAPQEVAALVGHRRLESTLRYDRGNRARGALEKLVQHRGAISRNPGSS